MSIQKRETGIDKHLQLSDGHHKMMGIQHDVVAIEFLASKCRQQTVSTVSASLIDYRAQRHEKPLLTVC